MRSCHRLTSPESAAATYSELIGKSNNPFLAEDTSIAANKLDMETVYQTLSNTFKEMSTYAVMIDATAEAAATQAATGAAETQPPAVSAGAADGAAGVLAVTTSLRPDTGPGREAPYAARTVITRPPRALLSASSDMAGTAAQTDKPKPPRDRSEAELLTSVSKFHMGDS